MLPHRSLIAKRAKPTRGVVRAATGVLGLAAAGYATAVATGWARYGHPSGAHANEQDALLDRFMPKFDVVERHHSAVNAPAEVTLAAAGAQDLMSNPVIRAIFKTRELVLGSGPSQAAMPSSLLPLVLSIGWRILAEVPGREVAVGAVTRPWEANVTFRGLDPDQFARFNDPGYVKIVWSLRAEPVGSDRSIFSTETRAIATDRDARVRFRRYWAFVSPGIWLIRRASLGPLKREAERRVTVS